MKKTTFPKPIVQEHLLGCAIACTAFILGSNYKSTIKFFKNGKKRARNLGFYCKEIVEVLNNSKGNFEYRYIKDKMKRKIYQDNTIVFIKRSKQYPVGHYLCRFKGFWMDPWINSPKNKNIKEAIAGFRKRLPGKVIYAIFQKK